MAHAESVISAGDVFIFRGLPHQSRPVSRTTAIEVERVTLDGVLECEVTESERATRSVDTHRIRLPYSEAQLLIRDGIWRREAQ